MEMYELCPGLLVRDGRTLLKVSSVYPTYVTAQVMLEGGKAPSRTKVRRYTASYIELYFDEATDGLIRKMDEEWGFKTPTRLY